MKSAKEWAAEVVLAVMTEDRSNNSVERLVERVQVDALEEPMALLTKVGVVLRDLHRVAPEGGTAEQACEFLLPKIEEALR